MVVVGLEVGGVFATSGKNFVGVDLLIYFLDLFVCPGLCIPANNTIFIKSISEKLAEKEPHLTLEFLEECIQGFGNSNIEMKHLCLEYITPWLPNLTR